MRYILNFLPQLDSLQRPDSLNAIQAELAAVVEKVTTTPTTELIKDIIDSTVSFGLKLLAALLLYMFGAWLIKRIKVILKNVFERRATDAAIASFVQSIVTITLTIMLIIITVGTLGIDTSAIAALLTGGGLAIGMALNGTVQNFAGGIMILIFKPFKAGDYIEAKGFSGTVSEVNITSTKLTTTDNRVIVIPNGILSNDVINNYSGRQTRRLEIIVGVEYGSSAEQTKEILLGMVKDDDRVLNIDKGAPADPFVALNALNDSSVDFILRVWVSSNDYWPLKFELNERIYKELPEHGIMFPFPQLDVNIKNS